MSRKENLQERFLDKPSEKLADLEEEIARQDAEAAKIKQEREEQKSSDTKYAPKDNFFKVDFQPASGGQTIARKSVASTGASIASSSPSAVAPTPASQTPVAAPVPPSASREEAPVSKQAPVEVKKEVVPAARQAEPVAKPAPAPAIEPEELSPPVMEEDALAEQEEAASIAPASSGSSMFFWNICIIIGLAMVGGLGYMLYMQNQSMPEDLLTKAKKDFDQVQVQYNKAKLNSFDVEKRRIRNKALIEKGEMATILEQNVDLKTKKIEDIEREILGVRGEMRSYFQNYKMATRRKARNLHFDTIMTTKTKKTYLDASVQRVTDSYVSIVHAGGAVRLEPSDLPEALQNRLGFGDPLGLKLMDAEIAQEKKEKESIDKYLPAAHSIKERQMMTERLTSMPSATQSSQSQQPVSSSAVQPVGQPAPVPSSSIEPPSGLPRVDTSNKSVDDNWVPPAAPMPFTEE